MRDSDTYKFLEDSSLRLTVFKAIRSYNIRNNRSISKHKTYIPLTLGDLGLVKEKRLIIKSKSRITGSWRPQEL